MRTTIEMDPELVKQLKVAQALTGEKQATIMRLALRCGLPLVLNRFQAPPREGYFAEHYKRAPAERLRFEEAMSKGLVKAKK